MTSTSRLELREAKRRCLERIKAMQAQTRAECAARERAEFLVRQMRAYQRCRSDPLNRAIFANGLRDGLLSYFIAHPSASECFLTTDQVIVLANQDAIPVNDQREYFRQLSIDKFLGCSIVAHDYWRFPETEEKLPASPLKSDHQRKSIFES